MTTATFDRLMSPPDAYWRLEMVEVDMDKMTCDEQPDGSRRITATDKVSAIRVVNGVPMSNSCITTADVVEIAPPGADLGQAWMTAYFRAKVAGADAFADMCARSERWRLKEAAAKAGGSLSGEDLIGAFYAK